MPDFLDRAWLATRDLAPPMQLRRLEYGLRADALAHAADDDFPVAAFLTLLEGYEDLLRVQQRGAGCGVWQSDRPQHLAGSRVVDVGGKSVLLACEQSGFLDWFELIVFWLPGIHRFWRQSFQLSITRFVFHID